MSNNQQTYNNIADYVKKNLNSISKEQLAEITLNTIIKQQNQIDSSNNLIDQIYNLKKELANKEKTINNLKEKNATLTKDKAALNKHLDLKEEIKTKYAEENTELKNEIMKFKKENREFKKEITELKDSAKTKNKNGKYLEGEKEVGINTRSYKNSKNKVSQFFDSIKNKLSNAKNKTIEKAKDKTEDFILGRKKNYHNRFQKARAFSKTFNDLIIKPTAKISKQVYKKAQNKIDKIHLKTQSNLSKVGINQNNLAKYTVMFVAVASEDAGKKIYQTTGTKRVVDMAANSKVAKAVKQANQSAVNSFKENLENNKNKAKTIEQKIENKKEAKVELKK